VCFALHTYLHRATHLARYFDVRLAGKLDPPEHTMASTAVALEVALRSRDEQASVTVIGSRTTVERQAPEEAHVETCSTPTEDVGKDIDLNTTDTNTTPNAPSINEAVARKKNTIAALPNEILDHIFSQLDGPAPSSSRLYDKPIFEITSSETAPFKSISLVCQQWRRLVMPILYRHARLVISNPSIPKPIIDDEHVPFLDFVHTHQLNNVIKSFALVIFNVVMPHTYKSDKEHRSNDFAPFWNKIFEEIDPLEVTLVCSPQVLGALTSCEVSSRDHWSFEIPYHILQLRRKEDPTVEPAPDPSEVPVLGEMSGDQAERAPLRHSVLFNIRPWVRMLLNEGSFLKVYKTNDTFLKCPPSILEDLVGGDKGVHTAMVPDSIRDFSYIAIFPTSPHFHTITRCCPRLDRLYTQFVPRNGVLEDPKNLEYLDVNDLWMERNTCYAYVMRELFSSPPSGNYRYLKCFESGDAADRDAWDMGVEYMKRAGGGWKTESIGVFVKDPNAKGLGHERLILGDIGGRGDESAPPPLL
jgi:F-box-like